METAKPTKEQRKWTEVAALAVRCEQCGRHIIVTERCTRAVSLALAIADFVKKERETIFTFRLSNEADIPLRMFSNLVTQEQVFLCIECVIGRQMQIFVNSR